jgi:hypothetical protein
MKLKQIKLFNKDTLTQEDCKKIFAIGGLWSHYLDKKYEDKKYFVVDKWYGVLNGGGGSSHCSSWNDPNYSDERYIRTHHGVEITTEIGTGHIIRIYPEGKLSCNIFREKGDVKSWSKDKGYEHYLENQWKPEYPCNQIDLIQLYVDLGFYTFE